MILWLLAVLLGLWDEIRGAWRDGWTIAGVV